MAEPASLPEAPSRPEQPTPKRRRDFWVVLGMTVSAVSAAVSSFSGLRDLAIATGWSPYLAPLLPLCIDSLAMTSVRVWVSLATRSVRARRYAKYTAVGAVLLSLAGNATHHVIAARLLEVNWLVVLSVGAIPALVLGLVSHLAVLATQEDGRPTPSRASQSRTANSGGRASATNRGPSSKSGKARPRFNSEDELWQAAREADAAYRTAHGRSIPRDELRRRLRISGPRATEVLRRIKSEVPP